MGKRTFEQLPDDMGEVLSQNRRLVLMVEELLSEIREIKNNSSMPKRILGGRFVENEVIAVTDPRLWEGVGAPFVSKAQVAVARRKYGCPFRLPEGHSSRGYVIVAKDLEGWLTNSKLMNKLSNKRA